jgi:VWFA-related protein
MPLLLRRNVLVDRYVRKNMIRICGIALLCGVLLAQQTEPVSPDTFNIVTTVDVVTTPVMVTDRDGGWMHGLRAEQFHLFDNEKEQNIKVDVTYVPISLVIVVESSSRVEAVLPQIRRIGSLIEPLVIGEQGEAAVVAYDARIRVLQDFTSDAAKVTEAVKKITPGSLSSRMVDGVFEATRLLRNRPKDRRRIIMLIGETRDFGSASRLRETLITLQLNNVVFYSVDVSRVVTTLTQKGPLPRVDPNPPAMHPLPSNVPATPNTVMQTWGTQGGRAEFLPLMIELLRDVKSVFKDNPVEAFTKGTGGSEFGFVKQRGLEDAVTRIGEELHSQYLISYSPNNKDEGGFHKIQVQVAGHPEYKIQTRPGYWLAPKK